MNREIYRDFSERMAHCGNVPVGALEFLFIAKSVERIADHAVNIAEEMVFLHQAGDIRHRS
jgi:phosphate transport system protein